MRVSRGCPAGACNPGRSPGLPASIFSVKQDDNRDSNHLRPLLSLRIPTVSCPACRRGNRQKDQPPRERERGAVPHCPGHTLRKQQTEGPAPSGAGAGCCSPLPRTHSQEATDRRTSPLGSGSGVLFPAAQGTLSGSNRPASPHSVLHFWKIHPWIHNGPRAGRATLSSLGMRSQPALESLHWVQGLFSDGT